MISSMTPRPDDGDSSAGTQPASPHGFDLSAADERLLRGPLPPRALAWAVAAVGAGARVREVRALAGGTSSAVHALRLEDACGRAHSFVLRRFVRLDWLAEEPDIAEREATALRLLADGRLPTPQLVAVDPLGVAVGVPAVLMTRLEGHIEWDPPALDPFLHGLAETLTAIHATPIPAGVALPAYAPYALAMHRPPVWDLLGSGYPEPVSETYFCARFRSVASAPSWLTDLTFAELRRGADFRSDTFVVTWADLIAATNL
jgi:hypothetical protein